MNEAVAISNRESSLTRKKHDVTGNRLQSCSRERGGLSSRIPEFDPTIGPDAHKPFLVGRICRIVDLKTGIEALNDLLLVNVVNKDLAVVARQCDARAARCQRED